MVTVTPQNHVIQNIIPVNSEESFAIAREVGKWVDEHPIESEVALRGSRKLDHYLEKLMRMRHLNNSHANRRKWIYQFQDADGKIHETDSIRQFAKDHRLCDTELYRLKNRRKRGPYQGWIYISMRPG